MRQNRSLSLKRETLTELTSTEMLAVNGGTHVGCGTTSVVTHPSFDACPTVPVNDCLSPFIAHTIPCL
jgi:natural product precursor